jgi:hypothetical protein
VERPWNKIGAQAGIVGASIALIGAIIALLAWLLPQQQASSTVESAAGKGLDVEIPPSSFDINSSSWQPDGPFYEARNDLYGTYGVPRAHAYGNSTGRFVYQIDIDEFAGARVELKARLSADAPNYSDPDRKYSDVTVKINDKRLPPQRVVPDDGHGTHYFWQFDSTFLKPGRNTIEFIVGENLQYSNGLCIYGDAIAPGETNERITLRSE